MRMLIEFVGANLIAIGAFVAGWIVGPRVLQPLFSNVGGSISNFIQQKTGGGK